MKTKKSADKRAKILQAAARVFAEKGYSLTTLADIGAEAGTFAGSLYYYFPSKEKIVEEVLNVGTTSVANLVMDRVESLPPEASIFDRIVVALETHLDQMLLRDDFIVAYWKMIDQVPHDVRRRHLSYPREYGKYWHKMLKDAQDAGHIRPDLDIHLVRLLLIGSTIYALQWFSPDGRYSSREIADTLADMFFFGSLSKEARQFGGSMANFARIEPRPVERVAVPVEVATVADHDAAVGNETAAGSKSVLQGRSRKRTKSKDVSEAQSLP